MSAEPCHRCANGFCARYDAGLGRKLDPKDCGCFCHRDAVKTMPAPAGILAHRDILAAWTTPPTGGRIVPVVPDKFTVEMGLHAEVRPGRYRHHKGDEYDVLGVAWHSESLKELVVYVAVKDARLWARPLHGPAGFLTPTADGRARFTPIEDITEVRDGR